MDKQYVCHISGQGEKWEVIAERDNEFEVSAKTRVTLGSHYLPKSEYRLCPAPEVWKDVTEECKVKHGELYHKDERVCWSHGYRLIKVQLAWPEKMPPHFAGDYQWAFIVEKKVQP